MHRDCRGCLLQAIKLDPILEKTKSHRDHDTARCNLGSAISSRTKSDRRITGGESNRVTQRSEVQLRSNGIERLVLELHPKPAEQQEEALV